MTTYTKFKEECAVYGEYQRRMEVLQQSIEQQKDMHKEELQHELEQLQQKVKKVDEVFDSLQENYGVETRMLLYRLFIGKEKPEALAKELQQDPVIFQFQVEADVHASLISIALQQYRGLYA